MTPHSLLGLTLALCTAATALGARDPALHEAGKSLEPVIGILTVPISMGGKNVTTSTAAYSYVGSAYARWLEMAGARVVPIPYDATPAELTAQFAKVNGVLFTGVRSLPIPTQHNTSTVCLFNCTVRGP